MIRESLLLRRNQAEILANVIEIISWAARDGSIEGVDYFTRAVSTALSGILHEEPEYDEPLDVLLGRASVLPFRTTALSFPLREVYLWKSWDFLQLDQRLEVKVRSLREFIHNPQHTFLPQ